MRRLGRALRHLPGARDGVSLVEFALVAPLLAFILTGGFEVGRFVLLNQKLNRLAANTSDLVTRSETMSVDEINNVFAASRYVVSPFRLGTDGIVIVSSVSNPGPVDSSPPVVNWQQRGAGAGPAASFVGLEGAAANLPAGFTLRVGQDVIIAEVIYDFEPFLFAGVTRAQRLYHLSVHRPRFGELTTLIPAAAP
jgi:hypothetical protein